MAADKFADYLVGTLSGGGMPPSAAGTPGIVVTPPPGGGYPTGQWFKLQLIASFNFVDLKFDIPVPAGSPHQVYKIDPVCILAFRVGPAANTLLGYKIRLNPDPPPLTAQNKNSGVEIFNGHVWGDHPASFHCLFTPPKDTFLPGSSQTIRFLLNHDAGDHGSMNIADVVLLYRREPTPT